MKKLIPVAALFLVALLTWLPVLSSADEALLIWDGPLQANPVQYDQALHEWTFNGHRFGDDGKIIIAGQGMSFTDGISRSPSGITKVQSTTSFTTGTSNAIALTGVGAGHVLTLQFSYFQASTTALSPPTDTNGTPGTCNAPTGQLVDGSTHLVGAQIWFVSNTNAGTHTYDIPLTSGGDVHATLTEWSAMPTTGLLDQHPASDQSGAGGTASITSGTTTTLAQANELALIAMASSNTGPGNAATDITNPPAGWTTLLFYNNTTVSIGAQQSFMVTAATTPLTAAWGWTNDPSTNGAQGVICTLKGL